MVDSVRIGVGGILGLGDEVGDGVDWCKVFEEGVEDFGEGGFESVDSDPTAVLRGRGYSDGGEIGSQGAETATDSGEGEFGGESGLVLEDCGFEGMVCREGDASGVEELIMDEGNGEGLC